MGVRGSAQGIAHLAAPIPGLLMGHWSFWAPSGKTKAETRIESLLHAHSVAPGTAQQTGLAGPPPP